MRHIIHIVESAGGGVLKYIQEITMHLDNEKYRHTIIYSCRDVTPKNFNQMFNANVETKYVPMHRGISLKQDYYALVCLYKLITELRPDIIHLHSTKAGLLGRIAAFLTGHPKVFYTPHCYSFLMESEPIGKRIIYFLGEMLLSQVKGNIIACSKSEYKLAKKLSWLRKKFLLENAIDMQAFLPYRYKREQNLILGVGRLDEQKDPLLFIRLVDRIKSKHPEIKAIWIGDGPWRKKCETLNHRLGTNITFTGWLKYGEVIRHLSKASVFLQTSKWEGLPYTILEALALGIPIVASNISSHRDVIDHGTNGFIAKNENDFSEYILKLIISPPIGEKISQGAILTYEAKYNYPTFISKLINIYEK